MSVTNRLVFNPTKPDAGSNVGAYVRSDDGTLITHHTFGSDEHLDVYARLGNGGGEIGPANPLDVQIQGTIQTAPVFLDGYNTVKASVTQAETDLIGTAFANRCNLWIYNNGECPFEIINTGEAYGDGYPLAPGQAAELAAGTSIDLKGIADTGETADVRMLEFSCP